MTVTAASVMARALPRSGPEPCLGRGPSPASVMAGERGADTAIVRLLVVYQHAPTRGAPGIYRHRRLLGELARRGWTVDLVSSPINYMQGSAPDGYGGFNFRREEIDGVTHHWVPATGDVHRTMRRRAMNYVTFAASAFARGASLPRPDVIWASSPPISAASVGRALSRRFRRPWIFEVRDLWPETAAAGGLLSEESRIYKTVLHVSRTYSSGADAVLVPTPGLVDLVKGHGAKDVTLVTGAVDDNPANPAQRRQWRDKLGVADDECLFAYTGAHGILNGLDRLLDAAEIMAADRTGDTPAPRFVLAGDGSARLELEQRLASHPVPGLTLLGPIPKDDVAPLLAASDVGLHMLRADPLFASALPTKVLEYFSAHRAFITTVPGLPEDLARASGGGFALDAPQLATELERWNRMGAAERAERGEQAFAYGQEHYGLEATADRLEELLMRLVRGADNRKAA